MNEAERAWQLWQHLGILSHTLYERYKTEFTEFIEEEKRINDYYTANSSADNLPF